jgi:hypothetical protein
MNRVFFKGLLRLFLKAAYIWQMATKWGYHGASFFLGLFYGVFVHFSTRGVQKHHYLGGGGESRSKTRHISRQMADIHYLNEKWDALVGRDISF